MYFFSKYVYILSTEELCLITLNTDAKFEEKLICCFKNDKKLVNFDLSTWKPQKFALLLLLCKVFNVWPKKLQRNYLSWHWWVMQNLKKNGLVVRKMTWRVWQILTRALESVKIGTLMGSFCRKYKMYEPKSYRGYAWQWGIDLSFQNWHKEFDKFWLEHLEI